LYPLPSIHKDDPVYLIADCLSASSSQAQDNRHMMFCMPALLFPQQQHHQLVNKDELFNDCKERNEYTKLSLKNPM